MLWLRRSRRRAKFCRRLDAIRGVGPLTATALIAAVGNGAAFRKGRGFAAWVGLVPREHSTGGKQKLLGISKRGNCYLRRLFVQGARAVPQFREKQTSGLSVWLAQLASISDQTRHPRRTLFAQSSNSSQARRGLPGIHSRESTPSQECGTILRRTSRTTEVLIRKPPGMVALRRCARTGGQNVRVSSSCFGRA